MKVGSSENTVFEQESFPFNTFTVDNATTLSHWHNHLEFVVIEEGKCTIEINGEALRCVKGDVVMISPQCLHSIRCISGKYLALVTGDKLLSELMLDHSTNEIIRKFTRGELNSYIYFYSHQSDGDSTDDNDGFVNDIRERLFGLRREQKEKPIGYEMKIKYTICMLLLDIYRYKNLQGEKIPDSPSVRYVKTALKYMDKHYNEKITLKDVSQLSNLSEQHFARTFKAYTGKTFMDYLTLYRLDMSNWYLKKTPICP